MKRWRTDPEDWILSDVSHYDNIGPLSCTKTSITTCHRIHQTLETNISLQALSDQSAIEKKWSGMIFSDLLMIVRIVEPFSLESQLECFIIIIFELFANKQI